MSNSPTYNRNWWLLLAALVITLAVGGYGVYTNHALKNQLQETVTQHEANRQQLERELGFIRDELARTEEENEELREDLEDAEEENENFENQIEDINETVGDISRYTSVDPELLKKYSRVFFLSENYVPSSLVQIDNDYIYDNDREQFHEKAYPFLEDMIEEAEDDGINLRIISAYRSFQEQNNLNDHYTVTYGAGTANQFSAEQGYSEHQLGTTVDFTTPDLGNNFTRINSTEAFRWLEDNAHEYGFVLSYPEGNQYYQYEPWHWRFVGVELAEDLDDDKAHFYDWSQRRIDEYRGKLFQG